MDSFNAGSVVTDWKLNLSSYKSALTNAEKLANKTGAKIGNNLNSGFSRNIKANAIGKTISAEILEGMDPGRLELR